MFQRKPLAKSYQVVGNMVGARFYSLLLPLKLEGGNFCVPTCSACTTPMSRAKISASERREKRTIAHRLWMGSMILVLRLHASAKRVVLL